MPREDDSDATRMFDSKAIQDFSKAFACRTLPLRESNDQSKKIRELTLQLAEAEANLINQKKLVDLAQMEVKELRGREKEVFERFEKAAKEVETLKSEINRLKVIERNYNDKKVSGDFLIQNYRSALSKYKTWHEYDLKQLEAMKTILKESGKWNHDNRYKIYFSYKSLAPTIVTDDQVPELAGGSVVDYKGIDDIDNINLDSETYRFLNNSTQTEENNSSGIEGSFYSLDSTNNQSRRDLSNNGSIRMSESELQFLDTKERMRKLEIENAQLRDKLIIAQNTAKKSSELEERNRDLTVEVEYLRKQIASIFEEKERLAENIQNNIFTDLAGPSKRATSRDIIERINQEKERNDTLLRRNTELEEEINRLKAAAGNVTLHEGGGSSQPSSQVTVEESLIYRHMIQNPFQQAVKEYEERENLKRRRLEDSTSVDSAKVLEQEEEIKRLKYEVEKLMVQQERLKAFQTDQIRRYRESVRFITGYDIKMRNEESIEAANVFDLSNHFSFERDGKDMNLIDNDYAHLWPHLMSKYLEEYNSLPCFTAAVTIELRARQLQSASRNNSGSR